MGHESSVLSECLPTPLLNTPPQQKFSSKESVVLEQWLKKRFPLLKAIDKIQISLRYNPSIRTLLLTCQDTYATF